MSEEPGYEEVVHALRVRLAGNPRVRDLPAEDLSHDLLYNGGLSTKPNPELVRRALKEIGRVEEESRERRREGLLGRAAPRAAGGHAPGGGVPGVDTNALTFRMIDPGFVRLPGVGVEEAGDVWNLSETGVAPGIYHNPSLIVARTGQISDAFSTSISENHLVGLKVEWVSGTTLLVHPGSAFIPEPGGILELI